MIEPSPLGRVFVVDEAPHPLFYTTIDFDGRIAPEITAFIRDRFGVDATLNTCSQVHGVAVHRAGSASTCDALFTTQPGEALAIKVADCLPVTIFERDVLANIHSGWRGTVQRITAATLDVLERETSFDAARASAFLGPTIRVCCFEVGEEVASQFDEPFVDRNHPKPHVDIVAVTTELLKSRGIAKIVDTGLCTRCDGSIFHSYRREGRSGGRNLAIGVSPFIVPFRH